MAHCWFCGQESPAGEKIYRTTLCSSCGRPMKACRNCEFYAPGQKYDCREHIQEPVRDKERENSCEYFSPNQSPWDGGERDRKRDEAKKKFDSLFNI